MKYSIQEIKNEEHDTIFIVRHFYFKVNSSKIKDKNKFEHQLNKVVERISSKFKLFNNEIKTDLGYIEDDFICDKLILRISVNCSL